MDYFVAWYNKTNSTDYASFDAIMAVAPAFFEDIQRGNIMKFSCTAEQFTELEKTHPEVMRWAYFLRKGAGRHLPAKVAGVRASDCRL